MSRPPRHDPAPADYRGSEYLSVYHFAPGREHDQSARHVGSFRACQYDACMAWRKTAKTAARAELSPGEIVDDPPIERERFECDPVALDEIERHVYPGTIALVPLTAEQLAVLIDATGGHAGRLADDPLAISDAWVPFASAQSYLARFQAALVRHDERPLSTAEAETILRRVLAGHERGSRA